MSSRLDHFLVDSELVATRSQAQQVIKNGEVTVDGKVVTKPSFKITDENHVLLTKENLWVGRGAEKLAGAHEDFSLNFKGKVVGDMGASTGGFVEYCLHHGASKVFAVDVGHDQLAEKLRKDSRVINLEGTNIKEGVVLEEPCDLIVVDLSFISLKLVLENILNCLKSGGEIVALVKPQFEVGKENLGKKGLVRDQAAVEAVLSELEDLFSSLNTPVIEKAPCRVKGNKSGNQEYFFWGRKQ